MNSWTYIWHMHKDISGNLSGISQLFFFSKKGRNKLLHFSLSGAHLCLVVWVEEQSIWTFPKHLLSVHPDGPSRPDTGLVKKSRRFPEVPVERRCAIGQRMAVKQKSVYCILIFTAWITASHASCWYVGGGGGALSRKLDCSQGRQDCLLQLWFLFKPHKSDRH